MTDEELIANLRTSKGWPNLGKAAADRIEGLLAEVKEWHGESMVWIEEWVLAAKDRNAAEDKLAKALGLLKKAQTYITDLEEHEGAEGFSYSTGILGETYYASLAELEKMK